MENLEGMLDLVENYTCGLLPLMITRKIVGIQVWSKKHENRALCRRRRVTSIGGYLGEIFQPGGLEHRIFYIENIDVEEL